MFGVVVSTPPLSLTERLHLPPALLGAVEIRRLMVGGRQPSPLRVTTLELIFSEPRRRGDRYQVPRTVHQHGSSQGSQTSRTSFVHRTRLQGHWLRMSKRSSDSPWATSRVQATVDCPERNEGMRESGVPKQAPQIFHKYLQPRVRRAGGRFTRKCRRLHPTHTLHHPPFSAFIAKRMTEEKKNPFLLGNATPFRMVPLSTELREKE